MTTKPAWIEKLEWMLRVSSQEWVKSLLGSNQHTIWRAMNGFPAPHLQSKVEAMSKRDFVNNLPARHANKLIGVQITRRCAEILQMMRGGPLSSEQFIARIGKTPTKELDAMESAGWVCKKGRVSLSDGGGNTWEITEKGREICPPRNITTMYRRAPVSAPSPFRSHARNINHVFGEGRL